jgi:hypothetical protein
MDMTPICQSCGMPMGKTGDFGSGSDGRASSEYCMRLTKCTYCTNIFLL